ncbi:MAG: DUF2125 domain-containing protein [Rhodospirillales bacterium]|nr:DUF2125 domain-containing protein [Rhodospirillales bacterium]
MRRILVGLLAALLVLAGVDTLAWYWATGRLAAGFEAWAQRERQAGWQVRSAPPHRAGWPLSATLVVPHLRLALTRPQPGEPWPITWQAQDLFLRVRPQAPLHLSLAVAGRQDIGLRGAAPIPYTASRAEVEVPLDRGAEPATLDLAIDGLRVGAADHPTLTIARLRLRSAPPARNMSPPAARNMSPPAARNGSPPAARNGSPPAARNGSPQPAVGFDLVTRDITLPPGRTWPLGRRIASVAAHGLLVGAWQAAGSPGQRIASVQRAGGRLVLHEAALRWGPLDASLAARLRLDPALRLEGSGRVMMSGYAQALDTLAANGAVGNDTAVAAKAALSLLAGAPHPPGPATITIPFTLRDGTLTADGLPLVRVPPLSPPPAPAKP